MSPRQDSIEAMTGGLDKVSFAKLLFICYLHRQYFIFMSNLIIYPMKKLKSVVLPMAILLLLGLAYAQKQRSKTANQSLPFRCATENNLGFVNVDSLHGKYRYDLVMQWNERLLAVYTTHYDGYPVCEALIGLWPKKGEKADFKATRKVVFFGSSGKWDSETCHKFIYKDGSVLQIGLFYPGPDNVSHCPVPPGPDKKLPNSPAIKPMRH